MSDHDHMDCMPRIGKVEELHREMTEARVLLMVEYDPAQRAALLATIADRRWQIADETNAQWPVVPQWVRDATEIAARAATDAATDAAEDTEVAS